MKPLEAPHSELSNKPREALPKHGLRRGDESAQDADSIAALPQDDPANAGAASPQDTQATADAQAPGEQPAAVEQTADASPDDPSAPSDDDDIVVAQAQVGGAGGADGGAGAGAAGDVAGAGGAGGATGSVGAAGAAGAGAGAGGVAGGVGVASASAVGLGAGAAGIGAATVAGVTIPTAIIGGAAAVGTIVAVSNNSGGGGGTPGPTTSVSGIHISADTGTSATDFLTSQASQTVTAQLSVALATGEKLYASLDGGTTFVDITSSVTGTGVSWSTSLLAGTNSIEFEVRNASNGIGPVATQAYTLDDTITAASGLTLALTAATDTGASSTDGITNIIRPTVAVSFDPASSAVGDVIDVLKDGTVIGTHTLTADDLAAGFAAVAITTDLSEGVNTLVATQTDIAGNSVTSASSFTVTLDDAITSGAGLTLALSPATDTGSSNTDGLTNIVRPTVDVTIDAATSQVGDIVDVLRDGNVVGSTTLTAADIAAGFAGVVLTTDLAAGANDLVASQTDAAGNSVTSATPIVVTLDDTITPAAALTLGLSADTDSGVSNTDGITNVVRPTVDVHIDAASSQAGDVIDVLQGGVIIGTYMLTAADLTAGFAAVALTSDLTEGTNTLVATQADAAGNIVTSATSIDVTLDTHPVSGVGLGGDLASTPQSDTGASQTDHITSNATPTFNVTFSTDEAQVGDLVQIREGTLVLGSVVLTADEIAAGTVGIALTTALTTEGLNSLSVVYVDEAGNETTAANTIQVTLDTSTAAPVVALVDDTGVSNTDGFTQDGAIAVSGVEAGGVVQYSTDGGATWVSSFTAVEGLNDVQVRVTDPAGNQAVTDYTFTVDNTPPAEGALSIPEADDGVEQSEVASDGGVPVIVPFALGVQVGSVITLTIDDPTTNQPVTVTYVVTAGDIAAGQASVLVPSADLGVTGNYEVSATVTDLAGNVSGAVSEGFTVLPAFVAGDDCQIFGLSRREYVGTDPIANGGTDDVYLVTHGLQGPVTDLSVALQSYDVYSGASLGEVAVTQQVGAQGIALTASGSQAGHDYVVGAAAFATTTPTGTFATAAQDTISNDRDTITIDSSDTGNGTVYLLADAQGGGSLAQAGSFEMGANVTAAGQAIANGAMFAAATGGTTDAVANVEACTVSIVANGSAAAGEVGAVAHMGAVASNLGIASFSGSFASASVSIGAFARDAGIASVAVHEDLLVSATSAGSGTATANMAIVHAGANGAGAAADIDIGGDVTVSSHSQGGNAFAVMGGGGAPALVATAEGSGATAAATVEGSIHVTADVASGSGNAVAEMGGLITVDLGAESADLTVDGDVDATAQGVTQAHANLGIVEATANGPGTQASLTVGGSLNAAADASSGDATATVTGFYIGAHGDSTDATVSIVGGMSVLATRRPRGLCVAGLPERVRHGEQQRGQPVHRRRPRGARTGRHVGLGLPEPHRSPAGGCAERDAVAEHRRRRDRGRRRCRGHRAHRRHRHQQRQPGTDSQLSLSILGTVLVEASATADSANAAITSIESRAAANGTQFDMSLGAVVVEANGATAAIAHVDHLDVTASATDSVASLTIAGGLTIQAQALAGNASATLVPITADASANGAVANLTIDGIVAAVAIAQAGDAFAQMGTSESAAFEAYASNSGHAQITLGAVEVGAVAQDSAHAALWALEAEGDSVLGASLNITGAVGVVAYGTNNAVAHFSGVYATANAVGGHATATVGGDIEVEARNDFNGTPGFSGEASASLRDLYAGASSASSVARLTIAGDVAVTAEGTIGGDATIMFLSAYAGSANASAEVTIDGNVLVQSQVSNGDATASLQEVGADVYHGAGGVASFTIGGEVTVAATGSHAFAHLAELGAIATSSATNANVVVDLAQGLSIHAVGTGGSATAAAGLIEAQAFEPGAVATLSIGGDVAVAATGTSANARLSTLQASANATADHTEVTVGGNVSIAAHAEGAGADAYLGNVFAGAGESGLGASSELTVGGISVEATGGVAIAGMGMGAVAMASAIAAVHIANDVLISSTATTGDATAGLGQFHLAAMGATSSSDSSTVVHHAQAALTIGGNLEASAIGSTHASAHVASMSAFAVYGSVDLDIGSSIIASAQGSNDVHANFISAGAAALDDSLATFHIGGGIEVDATALNGNATATMGAIFAHVSTSSTANMTIDGGVSITALGTDHAQATLEHVGANDGGSNSLAQVTIGADLSVDAHATGSSGASASINALTAQATATNSTAEVHIGGSISVLAEADDIEEAGQAKATLNGVTALAASDHAIATITIDGGIDIEARDWGSLTHTASALAGEWQVEAQGASSQARLVIAGDVTLVANANYGDNGLTAASNASASALFSHLGVTASGAHAIGELSIGGDVHIEADTFGRDGVAKAEFSQFSADASGSQASATLHIGGSLIVTALAENGDNAHATVQMSSISATASGVESIANILIDHDVTITGTADGSGAQAMVMADGIGAQASAAGAVATILIGGGVHVTAGANGEDATAHATFSGYTATGYAGAAHVTVVGDTLVQATATNFSSDARAVFSGAYAHGQSGAASASIVLDGPVVVQAIASSMATADAANLDVDVAHSQDIASITLGGPISVLATGATAQANFYSFVAESSDAPYNHSLAGVYDHVQHSGSVGTITLDQDITVAAAGQSAAGADFGGVSAFAQSSAVANVTIEADIAVQAVAISGAAHATMAVFSHYSSVSAGDTGIPLRESGGLVAIAHFGTASEHIDGNVDVSAQGASNAVAQLASVSASVTGSGYNANVTVGGGIDITAAGGAGYASANLYHVNAHYSSSSTLLRPDGGSSGSAAVTIDGDVHVSATAAGSADVFGGIYSAIGGHLDIAGNIDLEAHAGTDVGLQAGFFADQDGSVQVGDVTMNATSTGGDSDGGDDLLFESGAYDGASLALGNLNLSLTGTGAEGRVFLGADSHDGSLPTGGTYGGGGHDAGSTHFSNGVSASAEDMTVGSVDITGGAGTTMNVWADHIAWTANHTATLSGAGDFNFSVNEAAFAVVDATAVTGKLVYSEMLGFSSTDADHHYTDVNQFDYTVIKGFDTAQDQVGYGTVTANVGTWRDTVDVHGDKHDVDGINYGFNDGAGSVIGTSQVANVGTVASEAALFAALSGALNGAVDVAYAKYQGNIDLTGNVDVVDDSSHDWYAVAYDGDGDGITSLTFVQVAQGAVFTDANVVTTVGSPPVPPSPTQHP